jgi:hypothetical protein
VEGVDDYQFLRAMLEDAVATWPDGVGDDIRAAIRAYLTTHCRDCGSLLPEVLRRAGNLRCRWCREPPRPAIQRGLAGEDDDDEVPFR